MIYAFNNAVHLFLYDSFDDRPCMVDLTFDSFEDAEMYCRETYPIQVNHWIMLPDPPPGCQSDFIKAIRVKGRDSGNLQWGQFQRFDGKWVDISPINKYLSFEGMSTNECLFVSGLLDEFEQAKRNDRSKALTILANLGLPVDPSLFFNCT